jgi:hypothetical protein
VLLASLLMLVLLLVSLLSGILAFAGLPSAVDAVMFLLSLLQLASLHAVASFSVFASIPAFDCIHTACLGAPVVAYIPAVACVTAVVSGHDIAVSLMLLVALALFFVTTLEHGRWPRTEYASFLHKLFALSFFSHVLMCSVYFICWRIKINDSMLLLVSLLLHPDCGGHSCCSWRPLKGQ